MKATLASKFTEAGNAVSFIFQPETEVNWVAGQYQRLEITVDGHKDEHWFTISSAPYEKHLQVTTRLTGSAFKNALNNLKEGDQVTIDGIEGDFVWLDSDKPKIFIAGGIGITPFHSILKQRHHDGQSMAVTLLYSNRDNEIVFKAEFDAWRQEHPEFNVSYIIGERLSAKLIKQHAPELNQSLVYLSGPEPMVEAVGNDLKTAGLPEDQLKQDWFPGYQLETA